MVEMVTEVKAPLVIPGINPSWHPIGDEQSFLFHRDFFCNTFTYKVKPGRIEKAIRFSADWLYSLDHALWAKSQRFCPLLLW